MSLAGRLVEPLPSNRSFRTTVLSSWRFTTRADFEAVLRMEFPRTVADPWLAAHPGALGLSYSYALFAIDKPAGLLSCEALPTGRRYATPGGS